MAKPSMNLQLHSGGGIAAYCVEFYRDDDDNSGHGDNPRVSYWYAERDECQAIIDGKAPIPRGLRYEPLA